MLLTVSKKPNHFLKNDQKATKYFQKLQTIGLDRKTLRWKSARIFDKSPFFLVLEFVLWSS